VAPRIILTGGAAHNEFVEAKVMARVAEAQGVPSSALFVEPEAKDTIQNACYATRLARQHGWHSAEVVSSGSQHQRASLIFSRVPLEWRMHVAPPVAPVSAYESRYARSLDVLKTMRYLVYAQWAERCTP
jgi:uncharacterized SAM-binding protein YcdF (DUF218 family)